MKITIGLFGKFHAFYMAKAFEEEGALHKIITSYPLFLITPKISSSLIKSLFEYELLVRFLQIFCRVLKIDFDINNFLNHRYSKEISKNVQGDEDIFVGWSSKSLETFKKIKDKKTLRILERGSSHVLFQREILIEEYKLLGLKEPSFLHNNKIITKQLQEYELANYISVPSLFVKKTFMDYGIAEKKILLINYGIDEREFICEKKEIKEKFIILYVGTTEVRKGLTYLIQSLNYLETENFELHIVGQISDHLKSILPLNSKKIKIFGHQKQSKLFKFYNHASCLVHPSIEEGQSIVQIQSIFCGLPIVCTKNTGGKDLFLNNKDVGCEIPIRSPKEIANCINKYVRDPASLNKHSNNAIINSNNFSLSSYRDRLFKTYSQVFNAK
jgi:glycosyltransferase involved in cell wall biosynthesis